VYNFNARSIGNSFPLIPSMTQQIWRKNLEPNPGTYMLILRAEETSWVCAGRLGRISVQPGYYIYVGSARGPGGLSARVGRHIQKTKKHRWHIDYLRAKTTLIEVWHAGGKKRRECEWAGAMKKMGGCCPYPGFGSSDCRCRSHLFFFKIIPKLSEFSDSVGAQIHREVVGDAAHHT